MELSSVGYSLFFIIFLSGSSMVTVHSQSDPRNPSLPGVPLQAGSAPPADCGVLPSSCTYNQKLPDVNNCKKYYVCGFENNWQSTVCTGPTLFDHVSGECQSRATARCFNCSTQAARATQRPSPVVDPTRRPPAPAATLVPPATTARWADARDPACNLRVPCQQGKVMPDPTNCSRRLECNFNRWIPRDCPQGTRFDSVRLQCLFPRSATCQLPCPLTSTPQPVRIECMDPLPVPCVSGTRMGDPNDCTKFLVCLALFQGTSWHDGYCPKFFDPLTSQCSNSNANCLAPCGGSAPTPASTPASTPPPSTTPSPTPSPTPAPTTTPTTTSTTASTPSVTSASTPGLAPRAVEITLFMPLGELCNSPRRQDHSSCTAARVGNIHRHPTNCQRYFVCIGAKYWAPGACGNDEYWDITTISCQTKPPNYTCVSFNCTNVGPDSTATLAPPPTSSIGTTSTAVPWVTSSASSSSKATPAPVTSPVPETSSKSTQKAAESTSTSSAVVVEMTSTSDRPVTTSAAGPSTPTPVTSSAAPPVGRPSTRSSTLSSSTSTTSPVTSAGAGAGSPDTTSRGPTPTTTSATTTAAASTAAGTTQSTTSGQTVSAVVSDSVSNVTSPVAQPITNRSNSASSTSSISFPRTVQPTTTSSSTTTTTSPTITTPVANVPTLGSSLTPATSKSTPASPTTAPITPTSTLSPAPNLTTALPADNTTISTEIQSTTLPNNTTPSKATVASTITSTASTSTTSTITGSTTITTSPANKVTNATSTAVPPFLTNSTTVEPLPSSSSPSSPSKSSTLTTQPANMTNASSSLTAPTDSALPSGSPITSTTAGLSTPSQSQSTTGEISTTTEGDFLSENSWYSTAEEATTYDQGLTTESSTSWTSSLPVVTSARHELTTTYPDKTEPPTVAVPVFCEAETLRGFTWPMTAAEDRAKGPCDQNRSGSAYRACMRISGTKAMWEKPNFQLCVDKEFEDVLSMVTQLQTPPPTHPSVAPGSSPLPPGTGPTSRPTRPTRGPQDMGLTAPIMILARLTTKEVREKDGMSAGNLNASIEALDGLTQVVDNYNLTLNHMETGALFNTAGNALSIRNKMGWRTIREEDPSRGVTIMATVDKIGQQIAMNSQGNPVHRRTSSLAIRAEAVPKDELQTFDYTPDPPPGSTPEPGGIRDRVILEKETLEALSDVLPGDIVAMWSTYFYTINELLPVEGEQFINSRVLSVSVQSLPNGQVLKPPVELHFASLNTSITEATPHCSFWDFNAMDRGMWSDEGCRTMMAESSGTVCACDHLTNFAILMSPTAATGMHAVILSLISVVGCLLSILGMLVTICLYVLSWKRVKSHHAAVLLNLCIALIIANTTFLAGVLRTENKMVCTAVAAMLHFFYLVAFFMMFADGVQFILYVVQVFHVRRKKETFLLILTCWVIPAVIVAITMSITRGEGYGTEDYCWLRKDTGLIAAFAVPAIVVMIANFVILCKILHTISNSKGSERNNRVKATIWNIAVMMPLLGLTWVFGLFSVNDETIYFQYIFAVCNSLQGFFIFFFHCALNKKMRQAVVERFSSRSSLSSSLRKSGGSNKSEKKKGGGKQKTKKGKSKKPVISAPKPVGRPRAYVTPRRQGEPEAIPAPEPDYMDIDEARRGPPPPEGPIYPPYQGVGNGSLQRPHDAQDAYHSKERHNYSFDMRPEMHYEDVDRIDVGIIKDGMHNSPIRPMSQQSPLNNRNRHNYNSPDFQRRRGPEEQGWSPLQPRPSMSMDDLRMVGRPAPAGHLESPWMPEEDPYLFPSRRDSDMEMQMNPLQVTSQHQRAITFDPRRAIAQRSPYAERYRRMGSGHSRSLDRLDSRRGLPRRYNESAAGISTASMYRFASKEKGSAYIMLEPEIYENLGRFMREQGIMPPQYPPQLPPQQQHHQQPPHQQQPGHTSEEPVYMQIDDVTQVDSQMSLDYMAGRA